MDCTSFRVPDGMAESFPGPGGFAKTQAKIYFEYELTSSLLVNYKIAHGRNADSPLMNETSFIKDRLYLFDLGFFRRSRFVDIDNAKAYFVSRMKRKTSFYLAQTEVKYQLPQLIKSLKFKTYQSRVIPIQLFKSTQEKKANIFYLHLAKVSKKIRLQRLERQAKNHRKKGMKRSQAQRQEDKLIAAYDIYISNVPPEILASTQIRKVYGLRWQIELVFRTWKSNFRIDETRKCNEHRFKSILAAFAIANFIINLHFYRACKKTKGLYFLSFHKACELVKDFWRPLILALAARKYASIKNIIRYIVLTFEQLAFKEIKNILSP